MQTDTTLTRARRALVLDRLNAAWSKRPDMRLGQLLVEAAYGEHIDGEQALHAADDARLAELLERYVALRPEPLGFAQDDDDEEITVVTCRACGEPADRHGAGGVRHAFQRQHARRASGVVSRAPTAVESAYLGGQR